MKLSCGYAAMRYVSIWTTLCCLSFTCYTAVAIRLPSDFGSILSLPKSFDFNPTAWQGSQRVNGGGAEGTRAVVQNLTVYRITPLNYTGMTNMDTGDAAGDAFFGLYELTFPLLCSYPDLKHFVNCQNVPILNIPGYNVYTEFVVEVDARFGEYQECNPNPDTGVFNCSSYAEKYEPCWYDDARFNTTFAHACDRSQCRCDVIEYRAVGKESTPFQGPPPKVPAECSAESEVYEGYCVRDQKGKVEPSWTGIMDEKSCCATCNQMGYEECKYWSYNDVWDAEAQGWFTQCHIYDTQLAHDDFEPVNTCNTGSHSSSAKLFGQIGRLSQNLNGTWYSTEKAGQCQPGQRVGADCWWRIAETRSTVNATCVNEHLIDHVRTAGAECFSACPGNAGSNLTSACFVHCLMETLVGDSTVDPPVPAMKPGDIVEPFIKAFQNIPVKDGGCPPVPIHDAAYVQSILEQVPQGQGLRVASHTSFAQAFDPYVGRLS